MQQTLQRCRELDTRTIANCCSSDCFASRCRSFRARATRFVPLRCREGKIEFNRRTILRLVLLLSSINSRVAAIHAERGRCNITSSCTTRVNFAAICITVSSLPFNYQPREPRWFSLPLKLIYRRRRPSRTMEGTFPRQCYTPINFVANSTGVEAIIPLSSLSSSFVLRERGRYEEPKQQRYCKYARMRRVHAKYQ